MRIAIISDIHEDLLSLQNVFRKIDKSNIDKVACLGDISGFSIPKYHYYVSRNAHECLKLVRENCKIIVLGNHDMHAARIIPREKSYFEFPDNWYQLDYRERKELGRGKIWFHEEHDMDPLYSASDIDYLRSLTDTTIIENDTGNMMFSHYIFPNISGYKAEFCNYQHQFNEHFNYLSQNNCRLSFVGHSHIKGFYLVTPKSIKHHRFTTKTVPDSQVCIGIPPVTSNGNMSGFCIFDSLAKTIQSIRL